MPSLPPGYVYFILAPINNAVKIGYSASYPDGRFKSCNTGSPVPLERLAFMRGQRSLEKWAHRRFKAQHLKGEWYGRDESLAAFIAEHARPWRPFKDLTREEKIEVQEHAGESRKIRSDWQIELRKAQHKRTALSVGAPIRLKPYRGFHAAAFQNGKTGWYDGVVLQANVKVTFGCSDRTSLQETFEFAVDQKWERLNRERVMIQMGAEHCP